MFTIGLTGGIGSGKSTVARYFLELGAAVLDADQLARELVAPGQPALGEIVAAFGTGVLNPDSTLNRATLRTHIFADPSARQTLEGILHPRIRTELQRRAAALDAPYCIMCIPLLIESGWTDLVDRVLVIDVPRELQIQRTLARDGASPTEVERILASQCRREVRLAAADDVLVNDADLGTLRGRIVPLHEKYLALAKPFA